MKRFWYIIPAILVITSACSSLRYTGASNDDLYYRPSENPVTVAQATVQTRSADQSYYDNIYAADTLIADEFIPDNEYSEYAAENKSTVVNNYYGSAAERIYLFNDDYFYPYWRDPFYFSPYSLRLSFGYGYWNPYRSPYYWGYDPFMYDWYSPYSYYSPYYSPYYSYWGGYPYYGYNYYGYNYYPWYAGYGSSSYYNNGPEYISKTARRGGYSTMARGSYSSPDTRSKSGYAPSGNMTSRRLGTTPSASTASGIPSAGTRRTGSETVTYRDASTAGTASRPEYTRREATGTQTPAQTRTQSQVRQETPTQTRTQTQTQTPVRSQTVNRPEYQTTERSYTPSYNNPRVSSRPSYNTTRSSGTTTPGSGNVSTRSSNPSGSTQSYSPSRSSSSPVQYSSPSRSNSGSSYSSGSRSSGSSYSSGTRSSSSSGGSYSSGGSHSSGSSSGTTSSSSSSSSSSGRSSSGGRR